MRETNPFFHTKSNRLEQVQREPVVAHSMVPNPLSYTSKFE